MVSSLGVVVDDGVAVHDLGAHQLAHLTRGRLAMGARGAEQCDGLVRYAAALQEGEQGWQHGAVGHGSGQVGEDDHHPVGPHHQLGQGRPGQRAFQGPAHGTLLIGQARQIEGLDHRGVVRHLHLPPFGAVGELDQHGFSAWAPLSVHGNSSVAARTADATWSTWGRIRR